MAMTMGRQAIRASAAPGAPGAGAFRRARSGRERPDVVGEVDPLAELRVGVGVLGLEPQRDHAGPGVQRVVLVVVDRRAGADLGAALADRQLEDGRGLELLAVRPADVLPAAG